MDVFRNNKLLAQLALLALAVVVYALMDMREHFVLPDAVDAGAARLMTPVYFATVAQTGTGFGDVYPKTAVGRVVVIAHLCAAMVLAVVVT
jgi:hypothetical protein